VSLSSTSLFTVSSLSKLLTEQKEAVNRRKDKGLRGRCHCTVIIVIAVSSTIHSNQQSTALKLLSELESRTRHLKPLTLRKWLGGKRNVNTTILVQSFCPNCLIPVPYTIWTNKRHFYVLLSFAAFFVELWNFICLEQKVHECQSDQYDLNRSY